MAVSESKLFYAGWGGIQPKNTWALFGKYSNAQGPQEVEVYPFSQRWQLFYPGNGNLEITAGKVGLQNFFVAAGIFADLFWFPALSGDEVLLV